MDGSVKNHGNQVQRQGIQTLHKHCTNNPIPTSLFFHAQCCFPIISEHNQRKMSCTKTDVGMGLFVQFLYALSLHLVSMVFGPAIPTSLYIFGNVLFTLYIGMSRDVCILLWNEFSSISPLQCIPIAYPSQQQARELGKIKYSTQGNYSNQSKYGICLIISMLFCECMPSQKTTALVDST